MPTAYAACLLRGSSRWATAARTTTPTFSGSFSLSSILMSTLGWCGRETAPQRLKRRDAASTTPEAAGRRSHYTRSGGTPLPLHSKRRDAPLLNAAARLVRPPCSPRAPWFIGRLVNKHELVGADQDLAILRPGHCLYVHGARTCDADGRRTL